MDSEHHLIDLVMEFSDCEFFCHEKMLEEMTKHNVGNAPQWLRERISERKIKCFSDDMILEILCSIYHNGAISVFCAFLEKSCNVFEAGYYDKNFGPLKKQDDNIEKDQFLLNLYSCEAKIGDGKSLGEKKSYILLQTLQALHPGEVYVFCSDDRDARRNIMSIGNVGCVSVLSLFCELKYRGFTKQDVEPYFRSYERYCHENNQKQFRVWIEDKGWKRNSVPSGQVLDDIFDDRIGENARGDLVYLKEER